MDDLFQDGIEEFISYERSEKAQTKRQRKKQKENKMIKDLNDPQKKKQRNHARRAQAKAKLQKQLQGLNQQEARVILDAKKQNKKAIKDKMTNALQHGMPILIDVVYEKKMNQKQNKSLTAQIQLIMNTIKHIQNPPGVHLCSVGGYAKTQLEKMRYQYWPLTSSQDDIIEVAKKLGKKPVYLSPDAPEPLTCIDPQAAYIIGGLVDRTVIKNESLCRARDLQIPAYHLPIKQMMRSRKCLNLDHVVSIICKFAQTNDWSIAFEHGAPKRWKKSAFKQQEQNNNNNQSEQQQQQQQQYQQQQIQKNQQATVMSLIQKKQKQQQQEISIKQTSK